MIWWSQSALEGVALLLGLYAWLYACLLNFSLFCLCLSFRFSALCFYYIKSKPSQKPGKYNDNNARNRNQDEKWQQRQRPSKFWISEPGTSKWNSLRKLTKYWPRHEISENQSLGELCWGWGIVLRTQILWVLKSSFPQAVQADSTPPPLFAEVLRGWGCRCWAGYKYKPWNLQCLKSHRKGNLLLSLSFQLLGTFQMKVVDREAVTMKQDSSLHWCAIYLGVWLRRNENYESR